MIRTLLALCVVAAASGEDLAAWRFSAEVELAAAAPAIDLALDHRGLAQADARDVRVSGPDGAPVSLFVAHADATSARVLIDAAPGPGRYVVRFGNLSPALPALAKGMALAGRADFVPEGGFSAISYDPVQPLDKATMRSAEQTVAQFARWREQAATLAAEEAAKQPEPAQRRRFAIPTRLPTTSMNLAVDGVHGHWLHHVRAHVRIDAAGAYPFVAGNGADSDQLGVLLIDGDVARPAISGWYLAGSIFGFVVGTVGTAELAVGEHVLDFYTTRQNPELRMGRAGSDAPAEPLDGRVAAFPGAFPAGAGTGTAAGDQAAAWLATIAEHIAQGAHTTARGLCRLGRERFPDRAAEFTALDDGAEIAAYDAGWLTEGKYATRTAAVVDAAFAPPLTMVADVRPQQSQPWDPAHASTDRWVEGRALYGLPFDVQPTPYGVTGGTAVWDNVLYVGTKDGGFHAVDIASGRRRWSFACPGSSRGAPLVYRGMVYFGALDRRLYALDLASGRMAWNHPARDWIEGTPCAADGRIHVGSRDGRLYTLDARLGVERWQADLGAPVIATPLVDGGRVYVGTHGGAFVALDAATGAVVWRYDAGAAIDGGACLAGGLIAFGDAAGKVHGLMAADGVPAWPAAAVAGAIVAAPIRIGDAIWGGTLAGKGFAIDARDGRQIWTADLTGPVWRSPVFGQGTLIITTRGGSLHFRPAPPAPAP
ncbi:MAG TPA: PQQ-binding-like beta-propeller repeat protein [Planctomycetota bacterium]|nr:PQQ-binding-like beta-propeller repeat protein [Planctomycetota bacterium]